MEEAQWNQGLHPRKPDQVLIHACQEHVFGVSCKLNQTKATLSKSMRTTSAQRTQRQHTHVKQTIAQRQCAGVLMAMLRTCAPLYLFVLFVCVCVCGLKLWWFSCKLSLEYCLHVCRMFKYVVFWFSPICLIWSLEHPKTSVFSNISNRINKNNIIPDLFLSRKSKMFGVVRVAN